MREGGKDVRVKGGEGEPVTPENYKSLMDEVGAPRTNSREDITRRIAHFLYSTYDCSLPMVKLQPQLDVLTLGMRKL